MRYLQVVERISRSATRSSELLIYDEPSRCVYLPGQVARLPLRLPLHLLSRSELSERLKAGDRRQGPLLYRPECHACSACQAIRIDVRELKLSKSQRRIFRRGEALLDTEVGRPCASAERVALYNRHKVERDLLVEQELLDRPGYEQFLVETCADTIELRYRHEGKLVAVALADRASDALSAVYCYFDPSYARFSPGTYSILKQAALCCEWGLRYLYLGLYVAGCKAMEYKASYLPHERLIRGQWRRFDRVTASAGEPSRGAR